MTKNEFKLRALLAMCSNPKYVDGYELDKDSMIVDARELADLASRVVTFDDLNTLNDNLESIYCSIRELSQPDGKLDFMNDTLKGIEKSLDCLNELIGKVLADDEEEAEECGV